jgi:uncharacterized RDD family membrane protein YckC
MNNANAVLKFATIYQRFWAFVLDVVFFSLLFFPITYLYKGMWLMMPSDHDWQWGMVVFDPICLVFLIFIFCYFIFLEGLTGYTIGKYLVKIKVVNEDGNKMGLIKSFIRNIFRMVDGLPALNILGIFLILTTPEKTRLGDKMAHCRVICVNK